MLTRKQYELLVYIDQQLRKTGVSPSYDEMKDAFPVRIEVTKDPVRGSRFEIID